MFPYMILHLADNLDLYHFQNKERHTCHCPSVRVIGPEVIAGRASLSPGVGHLGHLWEVPSLITIGTKHGPEPAFQHPFLRCIPLRA